MAFENDWRIKDRPWDYLKNGELCYVQQYRPLNSPWDHEHYTFCFASIGENDEDLHSGYYTFGLEISKQEWICEKCFKDFVSLFKWKII